MEQEKGDAVNKIGAQKQHHSYRNEKKYDSRKLENGSSVAQNVLDIHYKITEDEFKTFMSNLDDIVNYITDSKNIHRKNNFEVARVMRIATYEYQEFLLKVLINGRTPINPEYRLTRPLVKKFTEKRKEDVLYRYLSLYEQYERTF